MESGYGVRKRENTPEDSTSVNPIFWQPTLQEGPEDE
jgi:hypothetical protein